MKATRIARAYAFAALFAVVSATACLDTPASAANDETAQVSVGATTTLALDGNPSTGYSWVFDEAGSENADLVTVSDAGYGAAAAEPGKRPVLGAPKKQQFQVTGVSAGEAKLKFNYVKSDGETAKSQEFVVEVIGASE